MAKRRTVALSLPDVIPTPLTSLEDPFWEDPAQVALLYRDIDQPVPDTLSHQFSWERFDAFRALFCRLAGLNNIEWPQHMDYQRAKDAGIDTRATSRYRLRDTSAGYVPTDNLPTVPAMDPIPEPFEWDGKIPFASYPTDAWIAYAHSLNIEQPQTNKGALIHAIADHLKINRDGLRPAQIVDQIRVREDA